MKIPAIKQNALGYIPKKYKRFIREKAIQRATTRILVAGNQPANLKPEDLEIVVREEEDKIKGAIKEKGVLAILTILGLTLFG